MRSTCVASKESGGVYVVAAVTALYLNVFVLVVQLFRRVPALVELAPRKANGRSA